MDTRTWIAALAGCLAATLAGGLFYGVLLPDFFALNSGMPNVMRAPDAYAMWAVLCGNLTWAFLLSLLFRRWMHVSGFVRGAIAGGWLLFLMALGFDLLLYGVTNTFSITAIFVDPLVNLAIGAVTGGTIGFVSGALQRRWPEAGQDSSGS